MNLLTSLLQVIRRPLALALLAGLAGSAAVGATAVAGGTTITVNTIGDGPGTCPATCTLRAALGAANNTPGSVTVDVPPGTYTLTQGELQVGLNNPSDIIVEGSGAAAATVIQQTGSASRVFDLDPNVVGGVSVTLKNLTITGGTGGSFGGGGILAGGTTSDTLDVIDSVISGNRTASGDNGGGISFGEGGNLTISGSTISGNTATAADGGGLIFQADPIQGGTLTVTGSTITGNQATAGAGAAEGGAVYIGGGGSETITGSTITGNTASAGGGAVEAAAGSVALGLDRIVGNGADAVDGLVTASNDWWGCNAGPGQSGCDGIGGQVHAPSWLVLRLLGAPTGSISTGSHVNFTADLTQNQLQALAGDLPDGTPVKFAANLGSVDPAAAATSGGQAQTVYTAPGSGGPDQVSATVDNQTVSAAIAVAGRPTVTLQPVSRQVCVGASPSFTAAASGTPAPTVQWQVSTDGGDTFANIAGATSGTYLLPEAILAENGSQYQAVFTNSVGSTTTNVATLTVSEAPTVTAQPRDATVPAFSPAAFTAAASGTPTVQWQASSDGGSIWSNVPGATSATLALTARGGESGDLYRAVFTSPCGSSDTQAASLTVTPVTPTLDWTPPPRVRYGLPLPAAVLDAAATFNGGPVAGTFAYTPPAGALLPLGTQKLSVDFTPADSADYTPAALTVRVQVVSLTSVSAVAVAPGSPLGGGTDAWTVGFTTSGSGALSVGQAVYLQAPPGTVFPAGAADYTVGGAAPASVSGGGGSSVTLILGSAVGDAAPVRVVAAGVVNPPAAAYPASDFTVATTTDAVGASPTQGLTFSGQAAGPAVTQQPVSRQVCVGGSASFTAAASGTPAPTVQWQVYSGGGTFGDIAGATAGTYLLPAATLAENGSRYRALFTNPSGSAASNAATLTVDAAPTVTAQPRDASVPAFSPAAFTAAASGTPSVQWQSSGDGGSLWSNVPGATSTTLALTAHGSDSGDLYRAVFTSPCGSTPTRAASLTVTRVAPTLAWTVPARLAQGTPLPASVLDATAIFDGSPVAGTFTYTPAAGTRLALGTQQLSVDFAPADTADYTAAALTVQVLVVSESTVSGVAVAPGSPLGGETDTWTVGFTTSGSGALSVGQAVYLQAPPGTVFPAGAADYTVGGAAPASVSGGGGSSVTLILGSAIGDGAPVRVVAAGTVNPPAGTYPASDFTVATTADAVPASPAVGLTFTATPSAPLLAGVSPASTTAGGTLTLTGSGFGATPSTVLFTQGSTTRAQGPVAGTWTDTAVRVVVPAALAPGTVSVAVRTAAGATSNALPLQVAAAPAAIVLTVPGRADPGSGVFISGVVLDAAQQPLSGIPVDLASTAGTLSPAVPVSGGGGAFTALLRLPDAGGTVVLTATAGSARASAEIVVPPPSSPGGSGTPPPAAPVCSVPSGSSLTLTASASPATGLPAHMAAAGPLCLASGAKPAQPLAATFQYAPAALDGLSGARVSVYALGAGGAWTFVPTTVDTAADTVEAYLPGPGTYAVLANLQRLTDVPSGYWAEAQIDQLLAAGVIEGFPGGTFQPEGPLTRAQFVKMLDLTLGLPVGGGQTAFTDVPAGAWYAPYVAAAARAGLVRGVTATTFAPQVPVTREQMAVLLARALHLTATAPLTFSDASQIDAWARTAVAEAVAAGYLKGFPDGTFQPLGPTTRAQAATVLALVIANRAPASG